MNMKMTTMGLTAIPGIFANLSAIRFGALNFG
jgi:hypothetical protein